MAVTMVSGARATDTVSSSLAKRSVVEGIYFFKPYQTPINQFFFGSKQAKLATGYTKFELQEDVHVPHSTTAASITGGSATETITVASATGSYFSVGDVLRVDKSGQNLRVTASAANTVSVSSLNASDNITAATSATLYRIGSAYAENASSGTALSTQGTFPYNYTQIFRRPVNLSGTQRATENYGGDDWTNQRVKATEQFKLEMERAWMFGVRGINTAAGANIRFSSGLLDSTSGAMGITDRDGFAGANDGASFADESYFFNTYCKNLFAKGTNQKVAYCGPQAMISISEFSKVKQQTSVSEKEYGADIRNILTPFGILRLQYHPLLEGLYSNWVVGVDRDDYMKYRFLSANGVNRDMQWRDNIQANDNDGRKAEYLAEAGFQLAGGSQGVHRVLYPLG